MRSYIFPGQGSQSKGIGEELFDLFPTYTEQADDILGYSIKDLCSNDPDNVLGQTQYTQPALFTVGCLSYLKESETGAKPEFLAGHSLGEYCALFAAGAFTFSDGLRMVQQRGQLMSKASGGGMAAVLACPADQIREVLNEHGLESIDIANYNSPKQTVISGPLDDLTAAKPHIEAANGAFIQLPVSAPFHSRYMAPIREEYEKYLHSFQYKPLQIPVIANVNALPYRDHQIIFNLKEQLCGSVRWTETVRYLKANGVQNFIELGPGNVLTRLIKEIKI